MLQIIQRASKPAAYVACGEMGRNPQVSVVEELHSSLTPYGFVGRVMPTRKDTGQKKTHYILSAIQLKWNIWMKTRP